MQRVQAVSVFQKCLVIMALCAIANSFASDAEIIGLVAMRRERPAITGGGIPVAHPEGQSATNAWEVNPIYNPSIAFTWTSDLGATNRFPNSVGLESGHADGVANQFYSAGAGVAPGILTVDNYDADYFFRNVISNNVAIRGQVANQSFIFLDDPSPPIDALYDRYSATYNVLFVSGMNNTPETPPAPGTSYNGIGVGTIFASQPSSVGPSSDGRAKPDIVAPHSCCTSFSTPLVSGAAVLLLQAGAANAGGAGTASLATNSAVVKALLLNGAVKTTNWTNGITRPLDARYGAGVLNIYNADRQLRGARHTATFTNNVNTGASHPPVADTSSVSSLRGWDFSTIQSGLLSDRVAHYRFDLPTNGVAYSATATLVWIKNIGPLKNLDLFLYDLQSGALMRSSTSAVDNVEHVFVPRLPAGHYDLQVLKRGGPGEFGGENYALAFDFAPVQLTMGRSGNGLVLSWPASAGGFVLQSSSVLDSAAAWQGVTTESILSNGLNTVVLSEVSAQQFFRLFRP